jgi:hypothetical protein
MHFGQTPPNAAIRPWVRVGELVHDALPSARIPPLDPAEDRGIGAVGQPQEAQSNSGLESYRVPSRQGLPRLSERTLIRAHRCGCVREQERHTLAQWDEIEARQRAFAADPEAVEAEGRGIERLLEGRA